MNFHIHNTIDSFYGRRFFAQKETSIRQMKTHSNHQRDLFALTIESHLHTS